MFKNVIFNGNSEGILFMARTLTENEERAFRLCHHEHSGKTIREAATAMGLREHVVRRLLKSMKRKAPQLFPILTQRQYRVYRWYVERGFSQRNIAMLLGTTQSNIAATLQRMKDKGMTGIDISSPVDVVQYDPNMDKHIRRKF